MGGLYKVTEWIMRIAGSNLLWLLCASPFLLVVLVKVTILFSPVPGAESETFTYVLMSVLAPFVLFPATSALFSVVRKWVMGESDLSIIKVYFKGYKENYKQSMIGGIFYTILLLIMIFNYDFYMTKMDNLQMVGIIIFVFLIILFVSLFNFFSMVAHYHMRTFQLIKNAILLTMFKPFRALSTLICALVLAYLTVRYGWLILFGLGSLTAFVAYFNFNAAYLKIQDKAEKMRQKADGNDANSHSDSDTDDEQQNGQKD